MELFLDTCDAVFIEKYSAIITGITTNPTIVNQFFKTSSDFVKAMLDLVEKYPNLLVNLQVSSNTETEMIEEGFRIASLHKNFIVKIPLTLTGLKALKVLAYAGIKVNGTLCFSLFQAIVAQDLGVTYVSPFLGRMEDAGTNIVEFLKQMRSSTNIKILAASIRNLRHIETSIATNCDAMTLSISALSEVFEISLLKKGMEIFEQTPFRF